MCGSASSKSRIATPRNTSNFSSSIDVLALSGVRGPAPVARLLYAETPESIAARERAAQARRLAPEPAGAIEHGRPTKRDRRQLADWQRWSASVDDLPGGPEKAP